MLFETNSSAVERFSSCGARAKEVLQQGKRPLVQIQLSSILTPFCLLPETSQVTQLSATTSNPPHLVPIWSVIYRDARSFAINRGTSKLIILQ